MLPRSDAGRCGVCKRWLYYQRVEPTLGIDVHHFFCRWRGRNAAWETGWTPGASGTTEPAYEPEEG